MTEQAFSRFFRIATSLSGLATGWFLSRNLPIPDDVIFVDHSATAPQSQGGQTRHGYSRVTLIWQALTGRQAHVLRALIETAEVTGGVGSGTLYLTFPRTHGQNQGSWIDAHGIAIMPQFQPVTQGYGKLYQNVSFTVNDVVVDNDPSDAV